MLDFAGAFCLGMVIGWITYRVLRRKKDGAAISDIAAVIGAVGGAGVISLFDTQELFSSYCIGLAIGFFGYFVVGIIIGKNEASSWIMEEIIPGDSKDTHNDSEGSSDSFMGK